MMLCNQRLTHFSAYETRRLSAKKLVNKESFICLLDARQKLKLLLNNKYFNNQGFKLRFRKPLPLCPSVQKFYPVQASVSKETRCFGDILVKLGKFPVANRTETAKRHIYTTRPFIFQPTKIGEMSVKCVDL